LDLERGTSPETYLGKGGSRSKEKSWGKKNHLLRGGSPLLVGGPIKKDRSHLSGISQTYFQSGRDCLLLIQALPRQRGEFGRLIGDEQRRTPIREYLSQQKRDRYTIRRGKEGLRDLSETSFLERVCKFFVERGLS